MSETATVARALFDHCVTTGTLDLTRWCEFKREHGVEPQQIEPVLVEVIGHLCTMSLELTMETSRLSHALAPRG